MKKVFSIVAGLCLVAGLAVFVPQVKAASNDVGMGCLWTSCTGTMCSESFKDTAAWVDFIEDYICIQ
jgi:hypothetical protein